jgi:hypothetical protein
VRQRPLAICLVHITDRFPESIALNPAVLTQGDALKAAPTFNASGLHTDNFVNRVVTPTVVAEDQIRHGESILSFGDEWMITQLLYRHVSAGRKEPQNPALAPDCLFLRIGTKC